MEDNFVPSTVYLIILLVTIVIIALIQKGIIEDLREEAITRGYAEKVIEKDEIVFKWK